MREAISTAGAARTNEDRVGSEGTLAWVIDGATDLYDDAALPAESDVQWLVDLVGVYFRQAGVDGYQGSAAHLLEVVATDIGRLQAEYRFPDERTPPACSIALCVDQGSGYDISRIGDATAVIAGARPSLLATGYFDQREAAAVGAREVDPERVLTDMHRRRQYTMTSGDTESVFSGHPQRQLRPHSVTGEWADIDHVLLCTDGFARLVTDYGLYPKWADVIVAAHERGLSHLEKQIRDVECGSDTGVGRFKHADDVTALLLTQS